MIYSDITENLSYELDKLKSLIEVGLNSNFESLPTFVLFNYFMAMHDRVVEMKLML